MHTYICLKLRLCYLRKALPSFFSLKYCSLILSSSKFWIHHNFLVHCGISNIFIRESEIQFESVALYFPLNLMTISFHTYHKATGRFQQIQFPKCSKYSWHNNQSTIAIESKMRFKRWRKSRCFYIGSGRFASQPDYNARRRTN